MISPSTFLHSFADSILGSTEGIISVTFLLPFEYLLVRWLGLTNNLFFAALRSPVLR